MDKPTRTTIDFNFGWRFSRGDPVNAYGVHFDDSKWREVRLPHDWSVEASFKQENTGGSTAFLPGGRGAPVLTAIACSPIVSNTGRVSVASRVSTASTA